MIVPFYAYLNITYAVVGAASDVTLLILCTLALALGPSKADTQLSPVG